MQTITTVLTSLTMLIWLGYYAKASVKHESITEAQRRLNK